MKSYIRINKPEIYWWQKMSNRPNGNIKILLVWQNRDKIKVPVSYNENKTNITRVSMNEDEVLKSIQRCW